MGFSSLCSSMLAHPSSRLKRFMKLLEPVDHRCLKQLARYATILTRQHFGRTMRMFAPLYLSNECINSCTYCGFSRENAILRVTLNLKEVAEETRHLSTQGFRSLLLVTGEHPKFISYGYLERCVSLIASAVPSVSLEVAPMETAEYQKMTQAGAEGLVLYQETYHRPTYAEVHLFGPKKNFEWRLDGPERAYHAGFRRLGVGALYGLWKWQEEAVALAAHIEYLLRVCWRAQLTLSLPRLRPATGGFSPPYPISDMEFVQLLCALRLTFPNVGIVLSTREDPKLRDVLSMLGVTHMSAGSHTAPGGYTGQGTTRLHRTTTTSLMRGDKSKCCCTNSWLSATEQFSLSDRRSPADVSRQLIKLGLDPIWKDWDAV